MCRLVAYAGAPIAADALVFGGAHSLVRQAWAPQELLSGSVNADGYGVAWYDEGRLGRIAEARPIWHDEDLRSNLALIRSPVVVAALRNSTPGIPVDRSGLLPLVHGKYAFALNGFVPDFRARHMRSMRAALSDTLYAALAGSSDSETLFLLTLDAVRRGAGLVDALADTVARVRSAVGSDEAQLNMVMSDGERVAAVRASTVEATNSLYVSQSPDFAPAGAVLASEPTHLEGATWSPVEPHSAVVLDPSGAATAEALPSG